MKVADNDFLVVTLTRDELKCLRNIVEGTCNYLAEKKIEEPTPFVLEEILYSIPLDREVYGICYSDSNEEGEKIVYQ